MIEKCLVKVVGNRIICDADINTKREEKKDNPMIKNKMKFNYLVDIGMELKKYHPTIIRTMIDGGRNFKIPENIKHQMSLFATEAYEKGFNPSLFGYNNTLHKLIKQVHNIPKQKRISKKKEIESSESETDLDSILSEIESDIEHDRIKDVKKKIKKYKYKIPADYYKKILNSIDV